MSQWYFSTNGKAQGPVSSTELIENLRAGKLTLVDLVFREGETGWCTIGEVPEFREAYNALPLTQPPVLPPKAPVFTSENPSSTALIVNEQSSRDIEPAVFEPGAFKRLISLAESHSLGPLAMPQAGWPHDWQLSTSWIVLKKRPDGNGFEQDGPFSAEHIIEQIGAGKIEYAQYCWKPGYTRWFRIGNLPEFDRRKRDRDNDTVNQIVPVPEIREALPGLTREELLASVERLRQTRRQPTESAPSETNGRDLVTNAFDVTPVAQPQIVSAPTPPKGPPQFPGNPRSQPFHSDGPVTASGIAPFPTPITPVAPTPVVQRPETRQETRQEIRPVVHTELRPEVRESGAHEQVAPAGASASSEKMKMPSKRAMRIGVAGAVAGLAVIGLLQFASHKEQLSQVSEVKSEKTRKPAAKPREAPKQKEIAPQETSSLDTPPPAVEPEAALAATTPAAADPRMAQNPGTTLEIIPLKLNSTPSLTFQTDAGVDQVISVRVTAKTGEILRYGSYSNSFEVKRGPGEVATLDLAKLELPPGNYSVTASAGAAIAAKDIFIGNNGPQFLALLERHIKGMSYRQQAERHAMFYGSQRLVKLGEALLEKSQTLKRQPKAWKKELGILRAAASEATRPVLAMAQAGKNETAFPDQLAAFQVLSTKFSQLATDVDASLTQQRDIASSDIDAVVADLKHLNEETGRLSGRPSASNQ